MGKWIAEDSDPSIRPMNQELVPFVYVQLPKLGLIAVDR